MSEQEPSIKITIPSISQIPNRVSVIKAIRTISGLGLKESKDITDAVGDHFISLLPNVSNLVMDEQIKMLRANGIQVEDSAFAIIEDLRKLGASALLQGEDELANEILQLVLAEKLRRNKLRF